MAITVTATQVGSPAAGMALRVFVLTQAAATQNGATANNLFLGVTSFTLSITTTQTGSRVYGASAVTPSATMTAAALTTLVDNIADATNNEQYVTFKATSLTGTPGATTLGFTAPAASSGPFAQAEIKTAGTLTEDPSSPAVVSTTTLTAVTTASFTPPAGSLLVALVSSDGSTGVQTITLSDTGSHTWTELVKNNQASSDYAGVWIAQIPAGSAVSGQVQPRATVPVPRRKLARGLWGGVKGQALVRVPRQSPYLPPRRKLARAWVQFTPVRTVNAIPGIAVPAPRQLPSFPRRPPGRALWRGLAVPAARSIPPRQPPYTPPRRPPARAYVRFTPVQTVNATVVAVPAPRQQPRPAPRRTPGRALWAGRIVRTVNAAPAPTPTALAPDRGDYERNRLLRRRPRWLVSPLEEVPLIVSPPPALELASSWPGVWPGPWPQPVPIPPEPEPEPEVQPEPEPPPPPKVPVYVRPPRQPREYPGQVAVRLQEPRRKYPDRVDGWRRR